jgi:5'(3')-deoxyribonucleotidase
MTRTVLLDCDGVLSDFLGAFITVATATVGRPFAAEQITEFDICKALGLVPDEAGRVYRNIQREGFAAGLDVIPGAIEGVRSLQEVADVYIVTSPWNSNRTWTYEREAWLKTHFGIPHKNVIHGSAKHLVRGDVLIDDKGSTVIEWNAAHPGKTAILWAAPYNVMDPWAGVRTNDWARVRSLVEVCK